jgi:2-polyprenyl-3-methyl-5-hydroxy-6-metoxy-1,4-benzoquinol methylase
MSTADFYNSAEPFYHLIFQDWQSSIDRQAAELAAIIRRRWGAEVKSILDATCGIGTQSLGLAAKDFNVTASDSSARSVDRLKNESAERGFQIAGSVCDVRQLWDHHQRQFDLVISYDNSLPHLNPDGELPLALRQMFRCTRPGGGCLVTIRDYANENLQGQQLRPYGVRQVDGKQFIAFQVWDCHPHSYDVKLYFIEDDGKSPPVCHVSLGRYYPITTDQLTTLMSDAGFTNVERLDGVFFQPVLLGDR